jgi:hypothetical protein
MAARTTQKMRNRKAGSSCWAFGLSMIVAIHERPPLRIVRETSSLMFEQVEIFSSSIAQKSSISGQRSLKHQLRCRRSDLLGVVACRRAGSAPTHFDALQHVIEVTKPKRQ